MAAGRLTTPFCRQVGVEVPILNVGFGDGAGPELAAAVSNAGGLGVIGASSLPPEVIRERIGQARALTDRPFGVNIIIAGLEEPGHAEHVRARIAAAIGEQPRVLVLFWGDANEFVEAAHAAGVTVLLQVGNLEEARAAAAAGVDAIIAQGIEAGGHVKGRTPIWELLPAVVQAVAPTPVLASGGIGDGHGIAKALDLGAQGVSLGTRFVASEEAWAHDDYKGRVVRSGAGDTFYGDLFNEGWENAPHRALKNSAFTEWDAAGRPPPGEREGEGETIGTLRTSWGLEYEWPRYGLGMVTPGFDGDLEHASLWAGESAGVVNDLKPAGQIVQDLVEETASALR